MARFHFRAGNAFEILTPEEHAAQIDRVVSLLARSQRPPNSEQVRQTFSTDGNGKISKLLFAVPVGMVAVVHRINVEATGYDRSAPLQQGQLAFALDSPDIEHNFVGLPASGTTVLPATIVDSVSAAQILKNGQELYVWGAGLPTTTAISFALQVLLWETEG